MNKDKEYIGVGGHLFAIAAEALSKYNGTMYAFAANNQLSIMKKSLYAEYIGILHYLGYKR